MQSTSDSVSPPRGAADAPTSALLASVQAHVRELLGEDDPEFTADLVTAFCETVGSLCDQAEAAMAVGNLSRVMASAHQIKGSAANVGLSRIAEDWHAVEEAARRSAPDHDRRAADVRPPGLDRRSGDLQDRVNESLATTRYVAATLSA